MQLLAFLYFSIFLQKSFACSTRVLEGKHLISGSPVKVILQNPPSQSKGTVVAFLSGSCPCSKSHEPVLKELSNEFQDFQFVAIHSNQDEPLDEVRAHFKESDFSFPILEDQRAEWANELKALKTPHVFVVGPQGQCWYDGGVDDSRDAKRAKEHYLKNALTLIREGKEPKEKVVRTLGCVIKR